MSEIPERIEIPSHNLRQTNGIAYVSTDNEPLPDYMQPVRYVSEDAHKAAIAKAKSIAFDQGFVLAVAEIIRQHGEDVIARNVLRVNTPKDWTIIDEYDMKALKVIFDHQAAVESMRAKKGA